MKNVLVCLFLRGAADGLNIVVPHGDPEYYAARPELAIATPGQDSGALDLDGFFGLHPALSPLQPIWQAGSLGLVHACGSPDPTHSHFDAMDNMERGAPEQKSIASGWLGRHLALTAAADDSPLRGVGFGALLQASLRGGAATAISSLDQFALQARQLELPKIKAAHGETYRSGGRVSDAGQQALQAAALVQKIAPKSYKPQDDARYPQTPYGRALMQVAQLIKADVGLEIACADIGDWDTHVNQGGAEGEMATNLAELSGGLAAFYADLADHRSRVTVVAMSEFGRRVVENGGGGTDHGHGNVMLTLGAGIQGGKVYGDWPGLAQEQRYGPGDLAVTTDFRSVLAALVEHRLGNAKVAEVFPGFSAGGVPGLLA